MLTTLYIYYLFIGIYITFGVFNSDLSPIYFVFVLLMSFTSGYKLTEKAYSFFFFVALIICAIFFNLRFEVIKTLVGLLLAFHVYWEIARLKVHINEAKLFVIALVYFFAALVSLIYPEILESLFYRVGKDITRGATGLAPEPSYLGLTAAFLYAVSYQIKCTKFTSYLFALTSLLSLSLYSYIVLGVLAVMYEKKRIIILCFAIFLSSLVYLDVNFRIFTLLMQFYEAGWTSISGDFSIAYRLLSVQDFLSGLTSFKQIEPQGLNAGFTRIMVEFGMFGLIIFLALMVLAPYCIKQLRLMKSFCGLCIFFAVYFIGPISLPAFYIWLCTYEKNI